MLGVSFQPGSQDFGQQEGQGRPSAGSGVQEAIRVLSLRLPRVVGAQSPASMPLLTSQGSGGNPMIDSIVNQILSRVPQQGRPQAPMQQRSAVPDFSGPSFSGASQPSYQEPQTFQPQQQQTQGPSFTRTPLFKFQEPVPPPQPEPPQAPSAPNFGPSPVPSWQPPLDQGPFTTENYSI
jgi:hypothetical protein